MKGRAEIKTDGLLGIAALMFFSLVVAAEPQRGHGGMSAGNHEDMAAIHQLFANHENIQRKVTKTGEGVETVTTSSDPKVATLLVEHAFAMKKRMKKNQPIRMWDPLFVELFANASKINMEVTGIPNGVRVVETSKDKYVVKLIHAHADAVSEFAEKGMEVMHKKHDLPQ
jgi:hypothetical protein